MTTLRSLVWNSASRDLMADWMEIIKKTVARFARGNISAQKASILMPEDQDAERPKARAIADKWRHRKAA